MGLDDFASPNSTSGHRAYTGHPKEEQLEEWEDELNERFPIDLDIEFIEVSPKMSKHQGKAFYRSNVNFIRISKQHIENDSDRKVKLTLLHEMCHVYFYQMGYKDTGHDKYFRWVVGRVMADMTNISIDAKKWQDTIEPFYEMEQDNE